MRPAALDQMVGVVRFEATAEAANDPSSTAPQSKRKVLLVTEVTEPVLRPLRIPL